MAMLPGDNWSAQAESFAPSDNRLYPETMKTAVPVDGAECKDILASRSAAFAFAQEPEARVLKDTPVPVEPAPSKEFGFG